MGGGCFGTLSYFAEDWVQHIVSSGKKYNLSEDIDVTVNVRPLGLKASLSI